MNYPRQLLLLLLSSLAMALASAPSHAELEQKCTDATIISLKAALQIKDEETVRASACKKWPDDNNKLLAAIAYEPINYNEEAEYDLPFYMVIVDANTSKVISRYKGIIPEDAATHVSENSLKLDTARYFLAKSTRAFGLRVSSFQDRCLYEGGFSNDFTLFVTEGSKIRPVLSGLTLSQWQHQGGNRCSSEENIITRETNSFLSVEPTISHGFHDLLITTKRNDSNDKLTVKISYDGESYSLQSFNEKFGRWVDH